jgi:hypothetical protein
VQPWGQDGDKRRYWLVEGQNDTHFRIYRESNVHPPIPKTKKEKVKPEKYEWFSVAGDIDALRVVAHKLEEEDGRKEAKALGERMLNAIPRFEASEAVRYRTPSCCIMLTGAETQASRIQDRAQGPLHRTRLRSLRRPHARKAPTVHIL